MKDSDIQRIEHMPDYCLEIAQQNQGITLN